VNHNKLPRDLGDYIMLVLLLAFIVPLAVVMWRWALR
jgi:hypothetical protein